MLPAFSRATTSARPSAPSVTPVGPPNNRNVHSSLAVECRPRTSQARRLIGRIIQNLDLQAITGIVKRDYTVYRPLNHVEFIVQRHLHGDRWQGGPIYGGSGNNCPPVAQVEERQDKGIQPVNRQPEDDQGMYESQECHCLYFNPSSSYIVISSLKPFISIGGSCRALMRFRTR